MLITKTSKKIRANFLLLGLILIFGSTCINTPLLAQSEQGYVLGIKNFEKSFPSDNSDWDSFENLYAESGSYGNVIQDKLPEQDISSFTFTFNHMALSVKDIDRSAEFYKNVLQLKEISNRSSIEGIRWLSLGENKELHLISTVKENVSVNRAVHLALTTNNFDEFIKHLEDLKVPYSDWLGTPNTINKRADGVKQIYFQDPDGYWIEVNNVAQK